MLTYGMKALTKTIKSLIHFLISFF